MVANAYYKGSFTRRGYACSGKITNFEFHKHMDPYLDILNQWQKQTADPFIYDNLDTLLGSYQFKRVNAGGAKDHWASRYKIDGTLPKTRQAEKTVVYPADMKLREQGDWDNPVDIVEYLRNELGLDTRYRFYEYLSERYGLDMPRQNSAEVKMSISRRQRTAEALEALQRYFVWNLHNNKTDKAAKVRGYLKTKRGFTSEDIESLGFGFVPAWATVVSYMTLKLGFSKEELDAACTVTNSEGNTSVGKIHILSIPYVCAGELKGFQFRRVDSDEAPKYMVNTGLDRKSVFFNMPSGSADAIVVVEGEMDALCAKAHGLKNITAIGGAEIAGDRRRQVESALSAGVKRIYLCPDLDSTSDERGNAVPNRSKRYRCVLRSIHTIQDVSMDFDGIYVVEFPEPSDPDEYIRKYGADAFRVLLRNAKHWSKYLSDNHSDIENN